MISGESNPMRKRVIAVMGLWLCGTVVAESATTTVCGQVIGTRQETTVVMNQADAFLSLIMHGDNIEENMQQFRTLLCQNNEKCGRGISYQYILLRYVQAMVQLGYGHSAASSLVAECPQFSGGAIDTAALDEMCRIVGRFGTTDEKMWMKAWYVLILREPDASVRYMWLAGGALSVDDIIPLEGAMSWRERLFSLLSNSEDLQTAPSPEAANQALRSAWERPVQISRTAFYRAALKDVYGSLWKGYVIRNAGIVCVAGLALLSLFLNCFFVTTALFSKLRGH